MPDFQVLISGIQDNISNVDQQSSTGYEMADLLRQKVDKLQNNVWIGESADAFYLAMEEFLSSAGDLNEDIAQYSTQLNKAVEAIEQAMQKIDSITAS
jgi:WXG100 family type VII secretion target